MQMDYLYTNAKSWGQWGSESKELGGCTRTVSTGSEGIKQHEIITIRRDRVRVQWELMVGFGPITDGVNTQLQGEGPSTRAS